MLTTERKAKALAYVDKAIKEVQGRITVAENALSVKRLSHYEEISKLWSDESDYDAFKKACDQIGYSGDEATMSERYDHYCHWHRDFQKTDAILQAYQAILTTYEAIKKEIQDYRETPEEDGCFYSDILGIGQVGLTSDQLVEFIDAKGPFDVEIGYDDGIPQNIDLRGLTLTNGISGTGKSRLLKHILDELESRLKPSSFQMAIVDEGLVAFRAYQKDPYLYGGQIYGDSKSILKFLNDTLPQELSRRRDLCQQGKREEIVPLILAFDNFDSVVGLVGSSRAHQMIQGLTREARRLKIYSIVNTLLCNRTVLGNNLFRIPNIIAFSLPCQYDSLYLLGEKGAEELPRDGSMILRIGGRGNEQSVQHLTSLDSPSKKGQ
jgi:hypothetical protein